MAFVRVVQKVLVAVAAVVFIASVLITLYMGIQPAVGILWSFFNMIGADFPIEGSAAGAHSLFLLAFYIIGIIGRFAFIVILTTIFYQALGKINISERIVESKVSKLSGHIVITPINGLSEDVARKFKANHIPYVLIDKRRSAAARMNREGILALHDDELDEFAMKRVNITKAHALLLLDEDIMNNTLIALTARNANERLRIVVRAKNIDEISRVSRVGASKVIIPESAAGTEIGNYISSIF